MWTYIGKAVHFGSDSWDVGTKSYFCVLVFLFSVLFVTPTYHSNDCTHTYHNEITIHMPLDLQRMLAEMWKWNVYWQWRCNEAKYKTKTTLELHDATQIVKFKSFE
jgi:hypothetical protein